MGKWNALAAAALPITNQTTTCYLSYKYVVRLNHRVDPNGQCVHNRGLVPWS